MELQASIDMTNMVNDVIDNNLRVMLRCINPKDIGRIMSVNRRIESGSFGLNKYIVCISPMLGLLVPCHFRLVCTN